MHASIVHSPVEFLYFQVAKIGFRISENPQNLNFGTPPRSETWMRHCCKKERDGFACFLRAMDVTQCRGGANGTLTRRDARPASTAVCRSIGADPWQNAHAPTSFCTPTDFATRWDVELLWTARWFFGNGVGKTLLVRYWKLNSYLFNVSGEGEGLQSITRDHLFDSHCDCST